MLLLTLMFIPCTEYWSTTEWIWCLQDKPVALFCPREAEQSCLLQCPWPSSRGCLHPRSTQEHAIYNHSWASQCHTASQGKSIARSS